MMKSFSTNPFSWHGRLITKRALTPWPGQLMCLVAACFCFAGSGANGASINSPFFTDDFEDNDVRDGEPVTWGSGRDYPLANVELVDGSLQLLPSRGNETLRVEREYDDVIIHAQVSLGEWHNNGDFVGLFARSSGPDCVTRCGAYWAGIRADGVIASGINVDNTPVAKGWTQTSLNARNRDVLLELELEGSNVRFRAWQEGTERPVRPQQVFSDRTFASGGIGTLAIGVGDATGAYRYFQTLPLLSGDFSGNGELDTADVDILNQHIIAESHDASHDLTDDNLVNGDDLDYWVTEVKQTWFGDANLNGEVDALDLNALGLNWQSADATSWAQGDFNGDGNVNASDLNGLALNWRSGVAAAASTQAVPEPSSALLFLVGIMLVRSCRRRTT